MTQEELAEKSGCSKRTIENAEGGKRVKESSLDEIALALDVKAADLVLPDLGRSPRLGLYDAISESRRHYLTGRWSGAGTDNSREGETRQQQAFEVSWDLRVVGRQVIGRGTIIYPECAQIRPASFDLEGGFLHERFCQLNYSTKEEGAVRFGSIIVDFAYDGGNLIGCYVGFSYIQKAIVSGAVELTKNRDTLPLLEGEGVR